MYPQLKDTICLQTNLPNLVCAKQSQVQNPKKLSDGGGLFILLHPSGSKYWRMKYRFMGKEKLLAIGVWPEVSLIEARERLLLMIIMFLLVGVGLLEGICSSVLAAAVEFTGSREGTTLGFAFTVMDGLGAFGVLLAGWAAGIQFSHAFLLAEILCTFSLILCSSVSLRSASVANAV